MTTDIPRSELAAVGRRHDINYDDSFDPTTTEVRRLAAEVRASAEHSTKPELLIAEAADLDALVDRIEREAGA